VQSSVYWYKKFLPEAGFQIMSLEPNGGFFKHYGEAGQQFVSIFFPNEGKRKWWKKAFFPVYLCAKIYAIF
jgi:hypothetical protein